MQRLILARHAESVCNVRGVLNGDPSVPGGLTERGREQARRLGENLAGVPIDLCVTTEFRHIEGSSSPAEHADPIVMERGQLLEVLDEVADDVFRRYSWETSGRPLLQGPAATNP